jgi:huntingtin-interacting protein 1-related protein
MKGRSADGDRSESELATNIRKATSVEETAPKRKHVRSCIVYTWDHKSSLSFWTGLKMLVFSFIEILLRRLHT